MIKIAVSPIRTTNRGLSPIVLPNRGLSPIVLLLSLLFVSPIVRALLSVPYCPCI